MLLTDEQIISVAAQLASAYTISKPKNENVGSVVDNFFLIYDELMKRCK